MLALFDREQRAEITLPEARREQGQNLVRLLRPAPAMNAVVYSGLDENNADAAIQAEVDYFSPMGQPFSWRMCTHDTPPDRPARLEQHGFQFDDSGDVMVLNLSQVPGELLLPAQNPAVEIRKIEQRDQLEDVIGIMEAVWGGNFGWMRKRLGGHLDVPGYLSMYVA